MVPSGVRASTGATSADPARGRSVATTARRTGAHTAVWAWSGSGCGSGIVRPDAAGGGRAVAPGSAVAGTADVPSWRWTRPAPATAPASTATVIPAATRRRRPAPRTAPAHPVKGGADCEVVTGRGRVKPVPATSRLASLSAIGSSRAATAGWTPAI